MKSEQRAGMRLSFRNLAVITSGVCILLAAIWMAAPQLLLNMWQVDDAPPALLVARRGGALFLGLGLMLWLARNAEVSSARNAIAAGLSTSCATLAILGTLEFALGHAGAGIWLAIVVEAALGIGFYNVRREAG
jgi:hypothetical protein